MTVPHICNTKSTYIFSKLKLFFALKFWRTGTGGQETRHYNNYNLYDFMIIFTSKPPHIPRRCDLSPPCQKADHRVSPQKGFLTDQPFLHPPPPPLQEISIITFWNCLFWLRMPKWVSETSGVSHNPGHKCCHDWVKTVAVTGVLHSC